jgi:phenylalanyl-tRNA synthetase alpha chain
VDEFVHPKTGQRSQCYRIVYRDMAKVLTQEEANSIHSQIEKQAALQLGVKIR